MERPLHFAASQRAPRSGVTLVEAMVALTLFTVSAAGLGSAYIHMMKYTERNSYEVIGLNAAQSIVEQIQLRSYNDLEDSTTHSFDIQLNAWNSTTNNTINQTVSIPWATDTTTFINVGVTEGGAIMGILQDIRQRDASGNTVRERRYMPLRVNLTRQIESPDTTGSSLRRIRIRLQYQWAIPGRYDSSGNPLYHAIQQIRVILSPAVSY